MNDPVLVTNPARPRDHGSGFVIRMLEGAGAQVVTCAHVVRTLGAEGLLVAGQPAKVIVDLAAEGVDLAVLAVPGLTEPQASELERGTLGDEVELLGFEPAGGGPLAVPHRGRLAKSSLTALAGRNRPAWHLQLGDGEIEGGHSGGPVVSVRSGKVVGVIAMGPDQQGGRDGVAVAIENLRLWPDAPAVVGRAPTPAPDESSGDSLLPEMLRPARRWWRRWGWLTLIAGVVAIGGAGLAMRSWSSPSTSPPTASRCAIPDLRASFDTAPVETWCPDDLVGGVECARTFADRTTVAGRCQGTEAVGDWRAVDGEGRVRWEAHFDPTGRRRTGTWTERRDEPSGAVFTATNRYELPVPGDPARLRTSRVEEWRCRRATGDSTFSSEQQDLTVLAYVETLSVPGGSFVCSVSRVGGIAVATECRRGLRKVSGAAAVDAHVSMLDSLRAIQNCQDTALPELPACGDGIPNTGEQCDDGQPSRTCNADCTTARCGDGILNRLAEETCDPGSAGETGSCNRNCTAVRCGDGVLNKAAREVCDPAPATGTKKCEKKTCQAPRCGDGIVNSQAGEQCEVSSAAGAPHCTSKCKKPVCGNRVVEPGEECDEGTLRSRRCTRECTLPAGVSPRVLTPTPTPVPPTGTTPLPATPIAPTPIAPVPTVDRP